MGIQKQYVALTASSPPTVPVGSSIIDQPMIGLVKITDGASLTLHNLPIPLVLGKVGYFTVFEWATVEVIAGSVAYNIGGALQINYAITVGTVVHAGTIPAAFMNNAVPGTYLTYLAPYNPAGGLPVPIGEGLSLSASTGDATQGNGSIFVHINYRHVQRI